jgi:predicted nucleotidyltransferase
MLKRQEIENVISENMPYLKQKYGVKKIGLFGSFVRNEETINSDVDILVEFERSIGWDFFDLQDFLEQKLGTKVDLVTPLGLKPRMKDKVLKEVVYQ